MSRSIFDRTAAFVSTHNRVVLLVMILLSAGVLMGIPQLEAGQEQGFGDEIETTTEIAEAGDYIEENYGHLAGDDDNESATASSHVYVRADDGNALDRATFIEAIEYQETVLEAETVSQALVEDGLVGPPNLIAIQLTGDPDADLETQREALEAASDEEVAAITERTFEDGEDASTLLPASYEPDSSEGPYAESFRMQFEFELDDKEEAGPLASPPEDAQKVLYETAEASDDPEFFTLGEFSQEPWIEQQQQDTIWLIIPPALLLVLAVLAFAYRDLVDVLIGFTGVVLSVLWMFGILGWLGVPAGLSIVIGPVLIVALSIDFGLHVFMRYREHRGPDDGIRTAMGHSTRGVAVAFLLVTVTAGIGFLSNLVNPIGFVRELGIAITLGVISAFVIFVTLVPALKVSVDGLLERVGIDRRKRSLGEGRLLRPMLELGVDAARRAAPVVIAIALLAGVAGGLAFADVDRQGFQQQSEVPEWQTELPGPLAWESAEMDHAKQDEYVTEEYRSTMDFASVTQFLIEGDATDPEALERVVALERAADDSDAAFQQGGEADVVSPLSVMETVADRDDEFAETFEAADTTDDGVPDRDLIAVYDALYEAAPEQAAGVIERTDDGEYQSLLVQVPVQQGLDMGEEGDAMHEIADAAEGGLTNAGEATGAAEDEREAFAVTPVGQATLNNAEISVLADDILKTMLIALGAVLATLTLVYWLTYGSALLGAITVVPIALVLGLVIGGMYLFGIPITFLTALLVSITIGLGIDYNIHVSDRFAQELERTGDPIDALYTAVTGTGGALLGSALTSSAAFSTLMLHFHAQFESFGAIVVLALALSFLLAVFVLPSFLYVWAGHVYDDSESTAEATEPLRQPAVAEETTD